MPDNKGLFKPTVLVTFFSILGIFISFLTQLIIAYYFGATAERDAYFVAITVPNYLSAIFTGSIGFIFLPKVVDFIKNHSKETLNNFLNSTFSVIGIVLITIIILCFIFSFNIIKAIALGFSFEQCVFTSKLLIIIIPTIIFSVLGNFLGSLYQVQHKFLRPALVPLFAALISLLFVVVLSKKIGIYGLAIGYLTGSAASFTFLLPVLKNFKFKFTFNIRNKEFFYLLKISLPLLLTGIIFRTTSVFERMIASSLPVGSISFLGYANQIMVILATVTSSGIAVSIYPLLSSMWAQDNKSQMFYYYQKGIRIILIITLPISVIFIFWGDLIVALLFERGAFNHETTLIVSKLVSIMIFAFISNSLGNIIAKIFYLSNKTILASFLEIAGLAYYLIPAFILSKKYGYIGMAVATSIGASLSILLTFIFSLRILKKFQVNELAKDLYKIILSITGASFVFYICYYGLRVIKSSSFIGFLITSIIFLILYLFLLNSFKIEEIKNIKKLCKTVYEKITN